MAPSRAGTRDVDHWSATRVSHSHANQQYCGTAAALDGKYVFIVFGTEPDTLYIRDGQYQQKC